MFKDSYTEYIRAESAEGANTPSSYIRAIDLLDSILERKAPKEFRFGSIWVNTSAQQIQLLYEYVIEQRKLGDNGIFSGEKPSSYWKKNYCSAALRSFKKFLIVGPYEDRLWEIVEEHKSDVLELSKRLKAQNIQAAEYLLDDVFVDFPVEGKEKLQVVKARVNQNFFRKWILREYRSRCCLTGLNIPEVLRASHISGWAKDKKNRMNPTNGLCLSATYDAAFDRHLITLDEDCRLVLGPGLKDYYSSQAFHEYFLKFEGRAIEAPRSFSPDQVLLAKHRKKTFSGKG